MKNTLLIILFLCSWLVQAQDYVVTAKNDIDLHSGTLFRCKDEFKIYWKQFIGFFSRKVVIETKFTV